VRAQGASAEDACITARTRSADAAKARRLECSWQRLSMRLPKKKKLRRYINGSIYTHSLNA
jgi:hypothetical protein